MKCHWYKDKKGHDSIQQPTSHPIINIKGIMT